MVKALVFDVDGTLYDESYPKVIAELFTVQFISDKTNVRVENIYNTFRKVKFQITKQSTLPERNDRKVWYDQTLQRLGITNVTKEEANEYYWKVMYENIKPFVDLMYVLPRLSQKYRLYTLSDELIEIQRRKMEYLKVQKYFVESISSQQAGETKPSQKLFRYALDIIGEQPSDIVMIGDNPSLDIKGGNLIGFHTAWLKRGKYYYYAQGQDEKPAITFTNYVQLEEAIRKLN